MQQQSKCNRGTCPNQQHEGYGGYCAKHARFYGVVQKKVPAASSRRLIQTLLDDGWTINEIATSAGLSRHTVQHAHNRSFPNVRRATHNALHTLTPRRQWAPAWRTARRIQALRAAGWMVKDLAAGIGTTISVIMALSSERSERTELWLFDKVDAFYREHEMNPVREPHPRTAQHQWPLPLEWVDIDDPQEHRGLLTPDQFHDLIPLPDDLPDAAQFLLDRFVLVMDAAAVVGVSNIALPRVAVRRNENITREYEHRIRYAAQREGWTPGVAMEVAA